MEIVNDNPFKGEGTLKYRGKNHKVKLTLNAFRMMTAKFKVGLDDIDAAFSSDPLTTLGQMTYCGIINASIASGKKFDDDFETFCAYFYEDQQGYMQMQELFESVNPTPNEEAEGNE